MQNQHLGCNLDKGFIYHHTPQVTCFTDLLRMCAYKLVPNTGSIHRPLYNNGEVEI